MAAVSRTSQHCKFGGSRLSTIHSPQRARNIISTEFGSENAEKSFAHRRRNPDARISVVGKFALSVISLMHIFALSCSPVQKIAALHPLRF